MLITASSITHNSYIIPIKGKRVWGNFVVFFLRDTGDPSSTLMQRKHTVEQGKA